MLKRVLLSLFAAAALLSAGVAPAQVAVDSAKTGVSRTANLLDASAVAVILPSSGSSNASGQITFTTALPATPVGTVGVALPAGVVTAGTQGSGAGVYQATCSSTTVCTLTGTVTTANAAYTQSTSEVALASVTIPAGAMGLNGAVEPRSSGTVPSNANSKTIRVRLGGISGSQFQTLALTASVSWADIRRIRNRGAANAQVGSAPANAAGVNNGSGSPLPTGAVDTTQDQALVYSGQLAVATDYLILENRETWLLP